MHFLELENVRLQVIGVLVQKEVEGERQEYVNFEIINGFGRKKCLTVLKSDCVRKNELIRILEEHGEIFPASLGEQRKIRKEILELISVAKEETVLIAPDGFFEYDGRWFCGFGNRVFAGDGVGADRFKLPESRLTLRSFAKEDFMKALQYPFIDREAAPMLFLAMILAVSDQILERLGFSQRFTTYIVGETGSYKSSIAREPAKVFQEKTELTLSSSNAAIGNGLEHIPLVINLLDDFNESEFGQIKRNKGAKIAELIQMHADRAERSVMCGNRVKNTGTHSALVITAEQPLKNPSSMNRCLLASTNDVHLDILTQVQRDNFNSGIFSALLVEVIQFFLSIASKQNFKEAVRKTYAELPLKYRNFERFRSVPGYPRILESYRIGRMGVLFWNAFFQYKSLDEYGKKVVKHLHEGLELSAERTFNYLQSVSNPDIEILQKLLEHIQEGIWKKRFAKKSEQYDDEKHLGIMRKNQIFISGDCLLEMLKQDFGETITKRRISSSLQRNGLLIYKGGKYSCSIPGSGSSKRFYCIRWEKFKELFYTEADYINELFLHG